MNSIYNKNIEVFKARFGGFYTKYKTSIDTFALHTTALGCYEEKAQIEVKKAKNGSLTANFSNTLLHSSYNPENEAEKLIKTESQENKDIGVFLGFALGYAPLAFCKNYPEKTLILIEPEIERVLWAFSYIDFALLLSHKQLVCLFSATPEDCISILEHFGIDNAVFIKNESHALHQKEYFLTLSELIERNIQKKEINDSTLERFGKLWLKNTIKNISFYTKKEGIGKLKNLHEGEKALILVAGPSLDTILPHLPTLSKKMIVICVDTALGSCLKTGIEPDYLITIDPQYWNAMHIRHLKAPNTVLITEISTYPSVFRFPCKDIYLTHSIYPAGSVFEDALEKEGFPEFGKLTPGGSVATSAWEFARWIGCESLYFAGLDLSFPKKQTHTKGSVFEKQIHYTENRLSPSSHICANALYSLPSLEKINYEGKTVLSDSRMELYAWWFESNIEKHAVKTYVLSKEGISIPGIDYFDFSLLLKEKDIEKKEIKNCPQLYEPNKKIFEKIKIKIKQNISNDLMLIEKALEITEKNTAKHIELLDNIKNTLIQSTLYTILPLAGKSERQIQAEARLRAKKENTDFTLSHLLCFFHNAKEALILVQKLLNNS